MSINSMTNAALARRPDYPPIGTPPRTAAERAQAASTDPTPENRVSTSLKTLTTYIPTEILTLYVAVIGVLPPMTTPNASYTSRWIAFGLFLLLTPVAIWITFASKLRSDGKALPKDPVTWPKWEMSAGTLAYLAWAFGLPGAPFAQFTSWYSPAVAGIVVLAMSTILGMIAGLFQRPLAETGPVSPQP